MLYQAASTGDSGRLAALRESAAALHAAAERSRLASYSFGAAGAFIKGPVGAGMGAIGIGLGALADKLDKEAGAKQKKADKLEGAAKQSQPTVKSAGQPARSYDQGRRDRGGRDVGYGGGKDSTYGGAASALGAGDRGGRIC